MKPKPQTCRHCPAYKRHQGFCPDWVPAEPRIWLLAEAPGKSEVEFSGRDGYGVPLIGAAGRLLDELLPEGVRRSDLAISNILRCRPPGNVYPDGAVRRDAESECRQYDTLQAWAPTVKGLTWHPSAVFRTPQIKPFIRRALADAWSLALEGERPLLCLGLVAGAQQFPWLSGELKRWQGGWWR